MDINLVTPATAPCVTADNLLEASRSSRPARRWESPQPSTMPMYHPGSRHIAAGLSTSRVVTSIYTADVRLLSSLYSLPFPVSSSAPAPAHRQTLGLGRLGLLRYCASHSHRFWCMRLRSSFPAT